MFRLFRRGGGTEQNKVDVFADGYVCSAAVIRESGQSQFAPLKLHSLALVTSSGARCAPPNFTYGSSTARLFLPRQGAPVTDSRPFRAPAPPADMRPSSANRDGVTVPGTVPPSGQPAAGLSPPGAASAFPPIKGKRSQDCVGTSPPQTCACSSPTAPRGQKRPGAAVPARPSLPRIRED